MLNLAASSAPASPGRDDARPTAVNPRAAGVGSSPSPATSHAALAPVMGYDGTEYPCACGDVFVFMSIRDLHVVMA